MRMFFSKEIEPTAIFKNIVCAPFFEPADVRERRFFTKMRHPLL